ncbi:hypothetical protein ACWED2_43975 [Amycolatopsis sp. NPDC005003]
MTSGWVSFAFTSGGQWKWYEKEGVNVPIAEVQAHAADIEAAEGADAARDFRALIKAKLNRAERGELHEPGDGRPRLQLRPGVMEIKWKIGRKQWRLYYSEPLKLRDAKVMLGLLFNRKLSKEQQDRDIEEAARRWGWWQGGA